MEQFKVNDGAFAVNEGRIRGAIKAGETIEYHVTPENPDIQVPRAAVLSGSLNDLPPGSENDLVNLPDPIPRTFAITASRVGSPGPKPLGPFTQKHLTIAAAPAPFVPLRPSIINGLGPNELQIRQTQALRFKATGR
jgi:hypothetical protein